MLPSSMRGDPSLRNGDGPHSIALMTEKKPAPHPRPHDPVFLTSQDAHPQRPSARNTPMLSFQLSQQEFITTQSSISGVLHLHIPKLTGKRFHFVSLTLHLRLKESIGWTRQDLVTFEIEKEDWAQTVWEKAVPLSLEDRQAVDESKEGTFVAVVKEPRAHGDGRIEIIADEWGWDWSLSLAEDEPRAESYEGSMGNIWYELEAKCLFRWDEVDKDGNIQTVHPCPNAVESALETKIGNALRVPSMKKSHDAPVKKMGSFVQAFSKMRASSKSNKTQVAGDFKIPNQHDIYTKESLRKRSAANDKDRAAEGAVDNSQEPIRGDLQRVDSRNPGTAPPGSSNPAQSSVNRPLPFLIRKNIKIYMVKPFSGVLPEAPSGGPSSLSPPHSPHGVRRLKSTLPGGQIQVQVQVPSVVYIPGYSKTSQLVPDSKTGGLVLRRDARSTNRPNNSAQHSSGLPESFDVILTVQKTNQDATRGSPGTKRQQSLDLATSAFPFASTGTSMSDSSPDHHHAAFERPGDHRHRRTEVRVRKVKCEFLQKEMCRIPTEGSPSRTIKFQLGPPYTYTNKERRQEYSREFSPVHQSSSHSSNLSWDEGLSSGNSERAHHRSFGRTDSLAESDMALLFPMPPQDPVHGVHDSGNHTNQSSHDSSPSTPRHHSIIAQHSQTFQHTSRPFAIQLPVSLTSPKLRQSALWPSPDPPITAPKSNDFKSTTIPTAANMDLTDLDIRDRYAYNARNYYTPHGGGQVSSLISGRPRIEVKHYLAIRVSAELLQYEGEHGGTPDFGLDLVGHELLHQDPGLSATMATTATISSSQQRHLSNDISGQSEANASEARGQKDQSPGSIVSTEPTSTTTAFVTTSAATVTSSTKEMAAVQSTTPFMNSTAGLSSTEMDKSHALGSHEQDNVFHAPPPLFGMAREVRHRRGSGASHGTAVSANSISSNHSNNVSAAHPTGSRLVANALNAIKKKASTTALNSMVNAFSGGQQHRHGSQQLQQQHTQTSLLSSSPASFSSPLLHYPHSHRPSPSTVILVQKLKDFVINVPVTILIQDPVENEAPSLSSNHPSMDHPSEERGDESLGGPPLPPSRQASHSTHASSDFAESKVLTDLKMHHRCESEVSFNEDHGEDVEGADELLMTEEAH